MLRIVPITLIAALTVFVQASVTMPDAAEARSQIVIVNQDGPGVGLNDPTPVRALPGNPGRTRGAQRLNVLKAAAAAWQKVLTSSVPIQIGVKMEPLRCEATRGVLAGASAWSIHRNFKNAPALEVWYPAALANAIAGYDLYQDLVDIGVSINVSVDDDPNCLQGAGWWYGLSGNAPNNKAKLYSTILHEFAHGLGFATFVRKATGKKWAGNDGKAYDDIFMTFLASADTNRRWPDMSDQERVRSATSDGRLVWKGPAVTDCAKQILRSGRTGAGVRMYAPRELITGSSVSHFDIALTPDELMEPNLTRTSDQRLTNRLLRDLGWQITSPACR